MTKIKWIDALKNVDKSDKIYVSVEDMGRIFDLSLYDINDDEYDNRLTSYYLIKWYCTDTWVGIRAIFFDDEFAGYACQSSRKSTKEYKFISTEMARKIFNFLVEKLSKNNLDNVPIMSVEETEKETEPFYTISYSSQLLVNEGYVNGEKATVIKTYDDYKDISKWQLVDVSVNGVIKTINMNDFRIPLHMNFHELSTEK